MNLLGDKFFLSFLLDELAAASLFLFISSYALQILD